MFINREIHTLMKRKQKKRDINFTCTRQFKQRNTASCNEFNAPSSIIIEGVVDNSVVMIVVVETVGNK